MPRQQLHPDAGFYDGVIDQTLKVEHNGEGFRFHSVSHQDCADILDHNKEVMARGGSRTTSFGKVELCIPELVLTKLKKKYPDLASPDKDIKVKAWKRFLRTTEAKPFLVSQRRYG